MLGASWRTFLTLTHLEGWTGKVKIHTDSALHRIMGRAELHLHLGVVMQRKEWTCFPKRQPLIETNLRYWVIRLCVIKFWEATFLTLVPDNDPTTALSGSTAVRCLFGFFWREKEKALCVWCSYPWFFCCYVYFVSSDSQGKCLRYVNATLTDPFLPCVCLAVWTAVTWVMTAMRPTLAAYPACLIAHHLSPGATASPALDFKQATPHLPLEDTRGVRLLPSTRPTRCHPAAPAASAARLALSSSKGWTLMTSSLVTWVTVTFSERACQTMMTTTWQTGKSFWRSVNPVTMTTRANQRWLHAGLLWKG